MQQFIRRSRSSLALCSSPRDDDDDLIPLSFRALERSQSILRHESIRDFLVHKTSIDIDTESITSIPSYIISGVTCYNQHTCNATKTIVVFHDACEERLSDFYSNSNLGRFYSTLTAMGFNIVLVKYLSDDFNLADMMENTIPSLVKSLTQRYKPKDLVIMGRGVLGSILASEFITRNKRISALVLESPVSELMELISEQEQILQQVAIDDLQEAMGIYCNNISKIENFRGKMIIFHSKMDEKLPVSHAEALYANCTSNNKGLVILEHGSHGKLFENNIHQYVLALRQFCDWLGHGVPNSFQSCQKELFDLFDITSGEIATAQTTDDVETDDLISHSLL
jgi:hypothetical protein